jgi:hypothetical protein
VLGDPPCAFDKRLGGGSVKREAAEDPRTLGKRMKGLDLGAPGGDAERLRADTETGGGLGEI